MKTIVIKTVTSVAALLGLLLLVGEMPEANMVNFAAVKILGLFILWVAVKVWEKFIPEEQI